MISKIAVLKKYKNSFLPIYALFAFITIGCVSLTNPTVERYFSPTIKKVNIVVSENGYYFLKSHLTNYSSDFNSVSKINLKIDEKNISAKMEKGSSIIVSDKFIVPKTKNQVLVKLSVETKLGKNNPILFSKEIILPVPNLPKPRVENLLQDNTPPKIKIIKPNIKNRGIKRFRHDKNIRIEGLASDEDGIYEILINGNSVNIDKNGYFWNEVKLAVGENHFKIQAFDIIGNTSELDFKIVREHNHQYNPTFSSDYYALIIGNNNYKYLQKLNTAKQDAKDVAGILKNHYGFKTTLLLDAKRDEIVDTLNYFRNSILKENDNFLIYYAGHGLFDEIADKAYWLPVDARNNSDTKWIIVDRITSNIKKILAKHILIVADSCYSGTLSRGIEPDLQFRFQRNRYLRKMSEKSSRTLIASGGNEPVSDSGGKGHSVFAEKFINGLKNFKDTYFLAEELFYKYIKESVAGNALQTPEYKIIRNSGHEGGDFLFKRITK